MLQIPAAQNKHFSGDIFQKMPVLRRRYLRDDLNLFDL
jgi:hypothetical protein